jgi:oligopeptidase A
MQNLKLPSFKNLVISDLVPSLKKMLLHSRAKLTQLIAHPDQDQFLTTLETLEDPIDIHWCLIDQLNSVAQTPQLRQIHAECVSLLSDYYTVFFQNQDLYRVLKQLSRKRPKTKSGSRLIQNYLRTFKRSGVDLPKKRQSCLRAISAHLAQLAHQFSNNVLDATSCWTKHIVNIAELKGIPEHVLAAAKNLATAQDKDGWMLSLEDPYYIPVLTYADHRPLREVLYQAYTTRASELDPRFDNSEIIWQILRSRYELSQLVGFKNYAHYVLADNRMMQDPKQVLIFLNDLVQAIHPKACQELKALTRLAQEHDGIDRLEAWDILYYQEKLRAQQFGIHEELIRSYFPIEPVLKGIFHVIEQLFQVEISEVAKPDVWHPDVRLFSFRSAQKNIDAYFYLDLYTRPGKHAGAWMSDYRSRRCFQGEIQQPVVFINCNFTPPVHSNDALLTHDDVLALAHELGHGLQHMLTQVDYAGLSGSNGVEWDAVELPSQFLEHFFWQKEILSNMSAHVQTNAHLPDSILNQLCASRSAQFALSLLRQIEFSLFDLYVHTQFNPDQGYGQIQDCVEQARQMIGMLPIPRFTRFQHAFGHIFSGGYAAGYYSYLWSEVLAQNCFDRFKRAGILNRAIGKRFAHYLLEGGGAIPTSVGFERFCRHKPDVLMFLKAFENCQ